MASEPPGETSVSVTEMESLGEWLDDLAGPEPTARKDGVLQLLAADRRADERPWRPLPVRSQPLDR